MCLFYFCVDLQLRCWLPWDLLRGRVRETFKYCQCCYTFCHCHVCDLLEGRRGEAVVRSVQHRYIGSSNVIILPPPVHLHHVDPSYPISPTVMAVLGGQVSTTAPTSITAITPTNKQIVFNNNNMLLSLSPQRQPAAEPPAIIVIKNETQCGLCLLSLWWG